MNTLVTGGAGFIGSHLVDALISEGHRVTVMDDLSNSSTKYLNDGADFRQANILDLQELKKGFEFCSPSFVFHLAAHASVSESVRDPQYDAQVNILGTINVLELCKEFKVNRLVFSSTGGALYGEPKYLPADEDHPTHPLSPYGASKLAAEAFIESISSLSGMNYSILRYGNVYGPRQSPYGEAGVVAIFIDALLRGESPMIFGDGLHQRDYVYVEDVVKANLLSLQSSGNEKFNIGTNSSTSVKDIYDLVSRALDSKTPAIYKDERIGDVRSIYLNSDRANEKLKWKPTIDIDNGIKRTVEWMRSELR